MSLNNLPAPQKEHQSRGTSKASCRSDSPQVEFEKPSGVWSFPISDRPVLGTPEDVNVSLGGENEHPPQDKTAPQPQGKE